LLSKQKSQIGSLDAIGDGEKSLLPTVTFNSLTKERRRAEKEEN
jgi:hypothetical protein